MMRRLVVFFGLVLAVVSGFATSTPPGFTDDYEAALKNAAEKEKLIYIVFSGSDWCGFCKALERELLTKPQFAEGVKDHWELVYIDAPKDTSCLSELAKRQNGGVRAKYGVCGFPTVYILDPKGEKLGNGDKGQGSTVAEVVERMNRYKVRYFKKLKLNERIADAKPGTKKRVMTIHAYLQSLSLNEQENELELVKEVLQADKKLKLNLKDSYFYFVELRPVWRRLQKLVEDGIAAEDKAKYASEAKKELSRLESRVRALSVPRKFEEQRKELVAAIKEFRADLGR